MVVKSFEVRFVDPVAEIDDDTAEAVCVEPEFLRVGHFSNCAVGGDVSLGS